MYDTSASLYRIEDFTKKLNEYFKHLKDHVEGNYSLRKINSNDIYMIKEKSRLYKSNNKNLYAPRYRR